MDLKQKPRIVPFNKLKITNLHDIQLKDIVTYVKNLHKHIFGQNKKIKKLKLKIKKIKYLQTLTKYAEVLDEADQQGSASPEAENVVDFITDIKNAATEAQYEQMGFIWEPTSGMYYDPRSGYYYNQEYGLYYNGHTGKYLRYNQENQQYEPYEENAAKKDEVVDEEAAIKKILEDGRRPAKYEDSAKKEVARKKYYHSSESEEERRARSPRRSRRSRSNSRFRRSRSRSRSRRSRSRRSHRSRSKTSKHRRPRSRDRSEDIRVKEDGEIGSSDSYSGPEQQKFIKKKRRKRNHIESYEEIAKKYPPSLRIIVLETNLDKIGVGKLFMVTYKGGSLGREGDHSVVIPDINVSKMHLKFKYNHKKSVYQVSDQGSKNGTILNGLQISNFSQSESEPNDLEHESIIQLAQTKLLCHVHDGMTTCDQCEPYNYIKSKSAEVPDTMAPSLSHKAQLKLLQRKFGLESEKYQDKPAANDKNYSDRAEKRRVKVGSSHDHEKTVQASVHSSITADNKGFKMLSKLGWAEGQSLGKSDQGIKEPILVTSNAERSGLGNENALPSVSFDRNDRRKRNIWSKTQERFNKLDKQSEIFGGKESDD